MYAKEMQICSLFCFLQLENGRSLLLEHLIYMLTRWDRHYELGKLQMHKKSILKYLMDKIINAQLIWQ